MNLKDFLKLKTSNLKKKINMEDELQVWSKLRLKCLFCYMQRARIKRRKPPTEFCVCFKTSSLLYKGRQQKELRICSLSDLR